MNELVNELLGAVMQVLLFALIPFIWWLITARKKENFFKWLGLRKINHKGSVVKTIIISLVAVAVYGLTTTFFINTFAGEVTSAGSQFAGKGLAGIPLAVIYGLIRTGLSEEILFRGFILKRISNKFGFIAGNTIQAIAFGLMHGIPFGKHHAKQITKEMIEEFDYVIAMEQYNINNMIRQFGESEKYSLLL